MDVDLRGRRRILDGKELVLIGKGVLDVVRNIVVGGRHRRQVVLLALLCGLDHHSWSPDADVPPAVVFDGHVGLILLEAQLLVGHRRLLVLHDASVSRPTQCFGSVGSLREAEVHLGRQRSVSCVVLGQGQRMLRAVVERLHDVVENGVRLVDGLHDLLDSPLAHQPGGHKASMPKIVVSSTYVFAGFHRPNLTLIVLLRNPVAYSSGFQLLRLVIRT